MKAVKIRLNFEGDDYGNVTWAHPALEVGHSYCNLKPDVFQWLKDNNHMGFSFSLDQEGYHLYFRDEQESILFNLRWS